MPAWASEHPGSGLVRSLRSWIAAHPSSSTPSYWQVEAHLRLAEELQAQSIAREECLGEYRWVLENTLARDPQYTRANAGLSRLNGEGIFLHPGLIRRATWGALTERPSDMDRARGLWKWITVHHSAMEVPSTVQSRPSVGHAAVRRVQSSHMNGRGYGDVGYHFLIDPAGRMYEGRGLRWQGAHAQGDNNIGNIGICLLGNFEEEPLTNKAEAALHGLVSSLQRHFAIGATHVVGHDHWTATQCPGKNLRPALGRYR